MKETRFYFKSGDESALSVAEKLAKSKPLEIIEMKADEIRAYKDPTRFGTIVVEFELENSQSEGRD